jgi:hypothetical protein
MMSINLWSRPRPTPLGEPEYKPGDYYIKGNPPKSQLDEAAKYEAEGMPGWAAAEKAGMEIGFMRLPEGGDPRK